MRLEDWPHLGKQARINYMLRTFKKNRFTHQWFADFERYIERPEFSDLLNAFIRVTYQYYQTHQHFGAKAVWEVLRWETHVKDGEVLFKLNNNYTSSVCQLVKLMFPVQMDQFFESRLRAVA